MPKVTPAQRRHIAELLDLFAQHASQLDYPLHDVRGSADAATWRLSEAAMRRRLAAGGRLQFDCSQFATQVLRWAGLKDPNGLDYDHAGYTGTMLSHLPRYTNPARGYVGSLVVYGPGTGDHVSMIGSPGPDPLLVSHGRPGLDLVRLSEQRRHHRAPVTLLSIATLG